MLTKRPTVIVCLLVVLLLTATCGDATPKTTDTPAAPSDTPASPSVAPTQNRPIVTSTPTVGGIQVAMDSIVRIEEGVPLARVNGEDLTWEDYEPTLVQTINAIARQSPVDWSDPAMNQRLTFLQDEALKQAVERMILRQLAEEQNLSVDPTAVEAEIEREKTGILQGDQFADWNAFLETYALTDETFERIIADTLLLSTVLRAQEVVTESEQVHISHIVVADEATAQEVVSELEAGEEWGEVAAQYSLDEETKDTGGDLGWFSRDTMLPEMAVEAFALPPGQFSGVIETQHGYTVILVHGREVREDDARVVLKRQQEALSALLDAAKAEAEIEYLVQFSESE